MSLHAQTPTAAPLQTKIRLALLATALCDALGAPAEFNRRSSFSFIGHMEPNENFDLPAGVWTDDTSMALALARSLATFQHHDGTEGRGGFDEADQLGAYYRWWKEGTLSATGSCFDIGNTIQRAVSMYHNALHAAGVEFSKGALAKVLEQEAAKAALTRIGQDMSGAVFGGNGSLMRVLPIGLAYWRAAGDAGTVGELAARSSAVTHPNAVCREACAVWAGAVARVVRSAVEGAEGTGNARTMTKLDVLHHFAAHPYTTDALRKALAAEVPLPEGMDAVADSAAMEAHYAVHHPVLRLVTEMAQADSFYGADDNDAVVATRTLALLPPASVLPSSGYVVHTIVAALYAFLATPSFEMGALLVANMGDDADTVAAVYGGLAGAWYAEEDTPDAGTGFWTARVRGWRNALVRRDLVEEVAEELAAFAGEQ
ncbi:ADP-ribosylation/Crystallin J1 [Mycena pura]|uniref:ADP-ribosylhydrolase ARH3 n=1 Tax=Mycena pura TaxID=153505 RepID=A0AAD6VW08_9AGAR|nr:ADP-ribosylation/Crystallin J1 [Mycena pura]